MKKQNLRHACAAVTLSALSLGLVACGGNTTGNDQPESDQQGEAQYPSEPVRFIVPYSAGGPTDVTARALAPCLEDELGGSVVVENVPGGSGALGMQDLIASEPDGHTLAIMSIGMATVTPLANDLDYSKDDITPVGVTSDVPMNLVVGADSPYGSAEEFLQAAKENPGDITVSVSGAVTPQAIELQRLEDLYGIDLTVVPFDGSAGATTALLGGSADAAFINDSPDVKSRIEGGSFVPLAVSSEERQEHLPEIPTLVELGFPELTLAVTTYGLAGPEGMPADIVATLEEDLQTCLQNPEVTEVIGERFVLEEFEGAEALEETLTEAQEVYSEILKN